MTDDANLSWASIAASEEYTFTTVSIYDHATEGRCIGNYARLNGEWVNMDTLEPGVYEYDGGALYIGIEPDGYREPEDDEIERLQTQVATDKEEYHPSSAVGPAPDWMPPRSVTDKEETCHCIGRPRRYIDANGITRPCDHFTDKEET